MWSATNTVITRLAGPWCRAAVASTTMAYSSPASVPRQLGPTATCVVRL